VAYIVKSFLGLILRNITEFRFLSLDFKGKPYSLYCDPPEKRGWVELF